MGSSVCNWVPQHVNATPDDDGEAMFCIGYTRLIFWAFSKNSRPEKLNLQKNSRPFFAKKLNESGFFEASSKKLNANIFV